MVRQDKKDENEGNDLFDQKFINVIPERYDSDPHSYNSRDSALYRLVLPAILGLVALSVLGVTVRHLFFADTSNRVGIASTPVIHADDRPIKTRPVDRGGMDIPNQDKLVYERVGSGKAGNNIEERLLPPPEQPVLPPAIEQSKSPSHNYDVPDNRQIQQQSEVPPVPSNGSGLVSQEQAPAPQVPASQVTATEQKTVQAHSSPALPLENHGWLVQLASVKSENEANKEWGRIRGEYRELLKGLTSDIIRVDLGEKGVFWRLRAGPLGEEQAKKLCTRLVKEDQRCMVVHK